MQNFFMVNATTFWRILLAFKVFEAPSRNRLMFVLQGLKLFYSFKGLTIIEFSLNEMEIQ